MDSATAPLGLSASIRKPHWIPVVDVLVMKVRIRALGVTAAKLSLPMPLAARAVVVLLSLAGLVMGFQSLETAVCPFDEGCDTEHQIFDHRNDRHHLLWPEALHGMDIM